jgi:hypothetical protein
MNRFFEVTDAIQDLKPVNTNIHNGVKDLRLVIICESPSTDEANKGYPAVSSTGKRIFNHLVASEMITSLEKFDFDKNYQEFERNGIYITNLVRYQADSGLKGETRKKDSKVRKLWRLSKQQLISELQFIAKKFPEIKVLLACGSAFEAQLKETTKLLNQLNIEWLITSHPSRSKNILSNNYNPRNWNSSDIVKTKLMKNIESYHKRQPTKT